MHGMSRGRATMGAAPHASTPYRPSCTENDYSSSGGSAFDLSELLNGKHHGVISFDLIGMHKDSMSVEGGGKVRQTRLFHQKSAAKPPSY